MGPVGDAYDKAMCESFFATLECEVLEWCKIGTKAEARMVIFEFIEGWYNPRRRHSAVGYFSPIDYETPPPSGRFTSLSRNQLLKLANSNSIHVLLSKLEERMFRW